MRSVLFGTLALSILNFTFAASDPGLRIFHKRDICTSNYQVVCYDNCMPPDGVCCDDGSGTYCPDGDYCVPNGCCPIGEHCSGGGGTITYDVLTGTDTYPTDTYYTNTATTAQVIHTTTHTTPTTANTIAQAATNLNAQTRTTSAVATTSAAGVFKGSGNAVSALSHSLERYALILIAGGQLLLGW
jgi:hypothetical protein